jgi:AraC-like DNA-binding protein
MNNVEFHLALNHNDTWNMSRLHFHDHYEFLLPLTSPGNIFVNDQVYPLERGTLYLIGESTLHRTMANGFHSRYILHISRKALTDLSTPQTDFTQLMQVNFRRATLNNEEMTELIELFQDLERNRNDGKFGSDLRQTMALLRLLLRIAPALDAATAGESIRNKDFLRVAPILDYIRDNLAEPLSLDQIASQFYLSKHYLCRIFKSATGFSVMEYIIYSRVLRARQLLQDGVSVQQAGEMSGFSDNSHFIRTFGHLTGVTPGRYAKEHMSSDQIPMRGSRSDHILMRNNCFE